MVTQRVLLLVLVLFSFSPGVQATQYQQRWFVRGPKIIFKGVHVAVKPMLWTARTVGTFALRSIVKYPRTAAFACAVLPFALPAYRRSCLSYVAGAARLCKNFLATMVRTTIGNWLNSPLDDRLNGIVRELQGQKEVLDRHSNQLEKLNGSAEAIRADTSALKQQGKDLYDRLERVGTDLSTFTDKNLPQLLAPLQESVDLTKQKLDSVSQEQSNERKRLEELVALSHTINTVLQRVQQQIDGNNTEALGQIAVLAKKVDAIPSICQDLLRQSAERSATQIGQITEQLKTACQQLSGLAGALAKSAGLAVDVKK